MQSLFQALQAHQSQTRSNNQQMMMNLKNLLALKMKISQGNKFQIESVSFVNESQEGPKDHGAAGHFTVTNAV